MQYLCSCSNELAHMPVCCWGRRCWADWGKASSSQVKYAAFWFSDGSVVEYRLRVDHTLGCALVVTQHLCVFIKEVRGRNQTSLLSAVRPLHQQRGGAGQPPQGPRRPGGCEGRAEDAGRRPQRLVMMIPTTVCVQPCCCLLPVLMCFATCVKADMFLFLCCSLT